jgi:hypothetical protein
MSIEAESHDRANPLLFLKRSFTGQNTSGSGKRHLLKSPRHLPLTSRWMRLLGSVSSKSRMIGRRTLTTISRNTSRFNSR